MTATDLAERSSGGRKIRRLAIGIVIFLIVYSAAWFLAANQIESRLQAFLTEKQSTGASVACDGMDVRGFPFRIGVFCDAVRLDDTARGASASLAALRSAAQVYQPGHAIIEIDGPAEIRGSSGLASTAGLASPAGWAVSADWALLHASLQATFSGLSRLSMTYDELTGSAGVPAMEEDAAAGATHKLDFSAGHGEAHFRQNGPDLDAALSIDRFDLKLDNGPSVLPLLNASADMTVVDRASMMDAGGLKPNVLRGSKGEMRNLMLDLGGGMVTSASGPFSVNDQGLISGEFHVTMKNIEGWRQNLVKIFTDEDGRVMIGNIANMLTALADGKNEATVKLNVRDGIAFLAFFPIGELPRL